MAENKLGYNSGYFTLLIGNISTRPLITGFFGFTGPRGHGRFGGSTRRPVLFNQGNHIASINIGQDERERGLYNKTYKNSCIMG